MTERIKCSYCDKPLKGCACSWKAASDGKTVHKQCIGKYNKLLELEKNKKEDSEQKKREE